MINPAVLRINSADHAERPDVAFGRTAAEACEVIYNLDRACRAQLAILASGARMSEIPNDVRDLTAEKCRKWDANLSAGDPEWDAYLRLVKREHPDFSSDKALN